MPKIKLKSKDSSPKKNNLGSLEQLKSKKYLEKQRKKATKDRVLNNYCDMLETQINSLVTKLLDDDRKPMGDAKQLRKHLNEVRKRINAAANELVQAQEYLRDNL